jgi:DNA-binding CsgD family transcriptional regulator/tetratricopeptide (TPR) repeat protein
LGSGGDILLSGTTADLSADDLPAGAQLVDLGPRQLRDFDRAERVFGLAAEGIRSPAVVPDTPAAPSLDEFGMTAREAEVLAAVGEQLTNAEIAARLYVSRRTIETHIAALLRKLGAANRRELAQIWRTTSKNAEPPPIQQQPPVLRTTFQLLADSSTFVGRHSELATARTILNAVSAGTARTLVIVGEPGVGKTRLAGAVAADAAARGFTVLYGRCEEGLAAPYQPVVEAFGPWLAACPDPALERIVGPRASELAQLWVELGSRLAVTPALSGADPQTQRWRLFEAITELVQSIAAEQPLLLVVDDVHWAEPSTLLLLAHLVRRAVPGTALVATLRPAESVADPAVMLGDLGTDNTIDVVELAGLDAAEIGDLIGLHTGARPPDELSEQLRRQTDGNLFFLTTLLTHLEDVSFIRDAEGNWVTADDLATVGVPQGLRAVIGRRLSLLSGTAHRTLDVAAVAGLAFDGRIVAGVLGSDLDETVNALDEAITAGVVREEDAGRYAFVHALMRLSVLDGLSRTRAARLNWRIAEELERDTGGRPRAGEIAYHYATGGAIGDAATIVRTSIAAGDDALQRVAFEEAAHHFRTALVALDRIAPDPDLRYRALTSLGHVLNALANPVDAQPLWLHAADIAQHARDPDRLFAAIRGYSYMRWTEADELVRRLHDLLEMLSPEDSPLRAMVLGWSAVQLRVRNTAEARLHDNQVADDAVAMARRVGDNDAIASTLQSRLLIGTEAPDASAMLRDAEEAFTVGTAPGAAMTWDREREVALWSLAIALLRLGRRERAEQHLALARVKVEQSGFHWAMNSVLVLESALATASGRFAEGQRLATEAIQHGGRDNRLAQLAYGAQVLASRMEQGHLDEVIVGLRVIDQLDVDFPAWRAMLAGALADAGRHAEAAAEINALIDEALSGVTPAIGAALAVRYLPEVCRQLGDSDRTAALLVHVQPWAGQILVVGGGTSIEGASDRSIGHLLATLGRHDEADAAYTAAAEMERSAGFLPHVARTEYWHARLLIERRAPHDRETVRRLRDDVIDITEQHGMRLLAEQAAQLT